MPSAAQWKRHFGVGKGDKIGGFTVKKSEVGHVPITPNEHYEFPMTITLDTEDAASDMEALRKAASDACEAHLVPQRQQSKILYSEYGSPYTCTFPELLIQSAKDKTVTLRGTGSARRRRDIPTLAQTQKEQVAAQDSSVPASAEGINDAFVERVFKDKSERKRMLGGVRVVKSRFGTGKCTTCRKLVNIGERIGKDESGGDAGKGGWSHLKCILKSKISGGMSMPTFTTDTDADTEKSATKKKKKKTKKPKKEESEEKGEQDTEMKDASSSSSSTSEKKQSPATLGTSTEAMQTDNQATPAADNTKQKQGTDSDNTVGQGEKQMDDSSDEPAAKKSSRKKSGKQATSSTGKSKGSKGKDKTTSKASSEKGGKQKKGSKRKHAETVVSLSPTATNNNNAEEDESLEPVAKRLRRTKTV